MFYKLSNPPKIKKLVVEKLPWHGDMIDNPDRYELLQHANVEQRAAE